MNKPQERSVKTEIISVYRQIGGTTVVKLRLPSSQDQIVRDLEDALMDDRLATLTVETRT